MSVYHMNTNNANVGYTSPIKVNKNMKFYYGKLDTSSVSILQKL